MKNPLVEIVNIKKHYPITSGFIDRFRTNPQVVKALNGVSLSIYKGETLGLVGESGCGKSTLGRLILHLEKPTEGSVLFEGKDLGKIKTRSEMKKLRRQMQMVFQNPAASLDPRMTIRQILSEPFEIHGLLSGKELENRICSLLEMVGLNPSDINKHSGDFSDGQKQRIALVRALSLDPKFIVADEPVSALDVSVQAQILNLIKKIQDNMHLTMLFISHDLHVVRFLSHRIAVIYLGKIVELGMTEEIYENHYHPYSEGLFSSVLDLSPEINFNKFKIKADVPVSQIHIPSGCVFQPRCPEAKKSCSQKSSELKEVSRDHFVACQLRS
jgi:oligopeptide transport system ATP-binding protein